jgi:protein gp37
MPTGIEWTEETWSPATGCSAVSPGCRNCYAARMARRLDGRGVGYDGTTKAKSSRLGAAAMWTGRVNWLPARLEVPLRWRRPRTVFVCSMADLFHEHLDFHRIAAVFGIMAATPHHTYQVLTKRAERMHAFFDWLASHSFPLSPGTRPLVSIAGDIPELIADYAKEELAGNTNGHLLERITAAKEWPLPNVWLGASAEDNKRLHQRLGYLMDTPAAVRFLSCEPLLEALDFEDGPTSPDSTMAPWSNLELGLIHWVIAGGESGAGSRPPHPAWFRKLRDDCAEAGVAFFFKQWGSWAPLETWSKAGIATAAELAIRRRELEDGVEMVCVGKAKAGRRLDGKLHEELPTTKEDTDAKT